MTNQETTKEGHAYTPGLKIKRSILVQKERRLPMKGKVFVEKGQEVSFTDTIAEMMSPGEPFIINATQSLGIQQQDIKRYMQKKVGDQIKKGEPLCGYNAFFGLMKNWVNSPTDGTIETISEVSGQIIVRQAPIAITIDSYIKGKVIEVMEDEGAIIETNAAFIQGIFGVGGETHGDLKVVVDSPDQHLTADMISAEDAGKVLVGGALVTKDALLKAIENKVEGIVVGGIRDTDLIEILGFEIGVAITGHEEIGLTLIITEGFGEMNMSNRTLTLLKEFEGYRVAINGATQIRAGVMRPEIIIPHDDKSEVEEEEITGGMTAGTPVRLIRQPYFGMLGKVVNLIVKLQTMETGSKVRAVEIELESGEKVIVPRANVEILEV
jgi:hypothetical protein